MLKLRIYPGAFQLFLDDQKKPLADRYIHCCRTTDDGGVLIITGVPFLIKLLDDPGVLAFDDDTTFKRVAGEMNEWELALFLKAVQRGMWTFQTIASLAEPHWDSRDCDSCVC